MLNKEKLLKAYEIAKTENFECIPDVLDEAGVSYDDSDSNAFDAWIIGVPLLNLITREDFEIIFSNAINASESHEDDEVAEIFKTFNCKYDSYFYIVDLLKKEICDFLKEGVNLFNDLNDDELKYDTLEVEDVDDVIHFIAKNDIFFFLLKKGRDLVEKAVKDSLIKQLNEDEYQIDFQKFQKLLTENYQKYIENFCKEFK